MKPALNQDIERYRIVQGPLASDGTYGNNGAFSIPNTLRKHKGRFGVVISDQLGWDHVSVSLQNRCPWWDEMCLIKNLFFLPTETVVQFHPTESEYVNCHEFCLHLWRDQRTPVVLPPSQMVGIKL